jgi:hypothetical protein
MYASVLVLGYMEEVLAYSCVRVADFSPPPINNMAAQEWLVALSTQRLMALPRFDYVAAMKLASPCTALALVQPTLGTSIVLCGVVRACGDRPVG